MSQEVEAPIQQQERAETATLTHHEPHTTSINANDNTTATTDAASHVASNSQTTLQPIVVPSKQLPTTVTDSNPITKPPSSTDPNDDEQLYQFLTKLTTVKPTVPPTLTRRIMHKQGVGFVDPLVPKLISSCGDKFIATILSQAIICRDRRVKGEIMKRKYEREMVRILKRRKIQDMDREKDLKKEEEALEEFIKNMKKGSLDDALEKKKKKTGVHFTFDSKKGRYQGEEGEGKDDNEIDDDLKQEEEYYASQMKAILGVDGTTLLEMTDIHLDGKKQYLEDESDEDDDDEDEDNERDMIQLVDVFRPLQAWGMSLVGKMGLASDPVVQTKTNKSESDDEEENVSDDENAGDFEEEEDETAAIEGDEKTPARKKKKTAVAGETGSTKRRRSVTPKPKSSPSSSGPALKKSKISVETVGADATTES